MPRRRQVPARTPVPASARAAARRLWREAAAGGSQPADVARSLDDLCRRLRTGLGRWLGGGGYRVVLDRALDSVRPDHPALTLVQGLGNDAAVIRTAARDHGVPAIGAAAIALLMALIGLLGRVTGEEMAVHLVEKAGTASQSGGMSSPDREVLRG